MGQVLLETPGQIVAEIDTPPQARANAARSKVRSAVETVFAAQKHRFGLFIRTIGAARAKTKIGLANIVYNVSGVPASPFGLMQLLGMWSPDLEIGLCLDLTIRLTRTPQRGCESR